MPRDEFRFDSAIDGFSLHAYRWTPTDEPRAVVVLAHGAAEHSLRYERFATALNAAGIEVCGLDHRGHGQSPGPEGLGDFGEGGWDALVADIGQFVDQAKAARPGIPVIIFSHSMGSFAAQQLILDRSDAIDALILSGSTARELPAEGGPPTVGSLNDAFEPARTPYDWLSRDEAEVDRYIADPLCGFEGRAGRGSRTYNAERLADPEEIRNIRPDLPILLVAGDRDPINRNLEGLTLLEQRYREAGIQRIDKQIYPEGRHEMLNELNREEVTANIIAWLNDIIG
jgi:alpha-beta hydrolase superfamily lysophospholipase